MARLDVYVAEKWPEYSRSSWQKLIKSGHVTVNGMTIDSTKYEVAEHDEVIAEAPSMQDHSERSLPIIYEDENVIVIDKPIGVLTHSKGALNDEFTVAEFVRSRTTYKLNTDRPGIVHRLDRATSGLIICAKNDETATLLSRQFNQRNVKKTYIAVLSGIPKENEANLSLPIGRNPSKPSTFRVDSNGKSAETMYRILRTSANTSLVELKPRTGRTHQLRVHMAYLRTPIVGDEVYGGESADRMYLHAHKLEITIPKGNRMTFESAVPDSFNEMVKE